MEPALEAKVRELAGVWANAEMTEKQPISRIIALEPDLVVRIAAIED